MSTPLWSTQYGDTCIIACAIHEGHFVRPEVASLLRLDEAQRRYEEDPHTGTWTRFAATRVVGQRSRFEFDLNRPREKAIYLTREDAWGLDVWKSPPPPSIVTELLRDYDDFYLHLHRLLERLVARHGRVAVFDLHTYNHARGGPGTPFADLVQNPEVNLGTGSMDREYWAPLVDRFLDEMRKFDFLGRSLDVRENVKFQGGHMVQWIHAHFPRQVCALAIEVKKFFMNEWTNEVDQQQFASIGAALTQAAAGVRDALENRDHGRRAP